MIRKQLQQGIRFAALCGCFAVLYSGTAFGAPKGPGIKNGNYVAVAGGNSTIYMSVNSGDVLKEVKAGESYQVREDEGDGWMEIQVGDQVGYISTENGFSVLSLGEYEASQEAAKAQQAAGQQASEERRKTLVNFALQFIGCSYRAAGSSPATGFDCSGFIQHVMQNGIGVSMNRSSTTQASQGVAISADLMRPGDLLFYGSGSHINHVAMYIGDGQVVHASTYKTGVKVSPWNYRAPIRVVNVLGD